MHTRAGCGRQRPAAPRRPLRQGMRGSGGGSAGPDRRAARGARLLRVAQRAGGRAERDLALDGRLVHYAVQAIARVIGQLEERARECVRAQAGLRGAQTARAAACAAAPAAARAAALLGLG